MEKIQDFLKPEFIWALIGLILLLLEFVTPGLIIFFFGIGAWIVAALCLCMDLSINAQLLIFIISSVVLLVVLRKWLKGIFVGHVYSKQEASEDLKEFLGEKVVVQQTIAPHLPGTVELHGTNWKARAERQVPAGTVVEIIGRESLTLIVKPVDEEGVQK